MWHGVERAYQGRGPHAVRLEVWSESKAIPKSQLLAQIPEEHAKVSSCSLQHDSRIKALSIMLKQEPCCSRLASSSEECAISELLSKKRASQV